MAKSKRLLLSCLKSCVALSLLPLSAHATFIESSIGTAVVNDATATFYNPAALTLLNNQQLIGLGSIATLKTDFRGQVTQVGTGFSQSGASSAETQYYLPAIYWGKPASDRITAGIAIVSNFFNGGIENSSILRYAKSGNEIQDIDIVPAVGFKINDYLSLGVGANFSSANFILNPVSGFPSLQIPDRQSRNEARGSGLGGDAGFLIKASKSTVLGFNYRSAISYHLKGRSILNTNTPLISNDYGFEFWTPARSVVSVNHFVTSTLGFIATIQRIEWDVFQRINIHGIATQVGPQARIVNASVPYYLHNSWLVTLGTHYRFNPDWVLRVAGTYNQSPANPNYQLSTGDSVIVGASVSYQLTKSIIMDASYAHAFIHDENIHIATGRNVIDGVNQAERNSVSLKLTFNA